jgi:DNA-binding ferritin-like protein
MKTTNNLTQLNSNVKFFLETQNQLKILHWQTKGYSRHIAFGDVYDKFDDLIDTFVESSMGKYGRFTLNDESKNIKIKNLSEIELSTFIKETQNFLVKLSDNLDKNDVDLLAIRDEMLIEINKLSYLLTLE